jgi:hypothetical protein
MLEAHRISRRAHAISGLLTMLGAVVLGLLLAAVAHAEATPTRIAYVNGNTNVQVYIASATGAEAKRLGPGEQPLLAPNGQTVAASLFGTNGDSEHGPALATYSALGAPAATYLDLETATADPLAWSPDSRYLAVARQSTVIPFLASGSGLDVIDTQTGTVTSIAQGVISGASFAQDGSDRLVFSLAHSLSPAATSHLFISAPQGGRLTRLGGDARAVNPVWGAAGIAYDHSRPRHGDAPAYEIWLQSPSGGAPRRLTSMKVRVLASGLVPLAFSGDGSRLLAEFEGEDTNEAWAVSVHSGRARRVLVRGRTVVGSGISRDGSSLLIDENGLFGPPSSGRIALVPFSGGASKLLLAHGSQASWNG